MKQYMIVILVLIGAAACSVQSPEDQEGLPVPNVLRGPGGELSRKIAVSLEGSLRIEGTLAEESEADNVTVEELVSLIGHLNLATITVRPPYPEHLWLSFSAITNFGFPEQPVVLRIKFLVDDQEVDSLAIVMDEEVREEALFDGMEKVVDIMPALDTIPDTILVTARGEALLMPEEMDEDAIDPETATAAPDQKTFVLSNPVRINFIAAEDTS